MRGNVMPKDLPPVSAFVADAIAEMLISDQGMLRPPRKAAELLALIVELHELKHPFPERAAVARHIGASVSTIDAALSTRLDEGYISQRTETETGNVERRHSAVRKTFYDPSAKLLSVARRAKQRRTSNGR